MPKFFRGASRSGSTLDCTLTSRILRISSKDAEGDKWC